VSSRVVGSVVVVGETPKPSRSPIRAPSDFHLLCLSCIRHSRSTLSVPSPLWSPLWSPRNSTQLHFKPTPTGSWFLVLGSWFSLSTSAYPPAGRRDRRFRPSFLHARWDLGRCWCILPSSTSVLRYPTYIVQGPPILPSISSTPPHLHLAGQSTQQGRAELGNNSSSPAALPIGKGPATLPTGLRSHGPSRIRSRAVTHARIPRGAANISVSR
jgi:hypothetical protein